MTMNNADRITARILDMISGELPQWRRPWRTLAHQGRSAIPVNAVTGRAYRGANVFLLWSRSDEDMRYVTFNQAKLLGGHVKKGEHGTQVIFWKPRKYKARDEATGEEQEKRSLLLKVYTVFNVAQCEGLKLKKAEPPQPPPLVMSDLYAKIGARVEHAGDSAFYAPGPDLVVMPPAQAFTSPDAYAATGLHELTHWTGHKSRLNRDLGNRFGTKAYAAEELVAELGAAFLCAHFGINCELEHHASYIQHWRDIMKGDARAIFTASSKAQQAIDHLLGAVASEAEDEAEPTDEDETILEAA